MALRIYNHSASTQSIHALFTLSSETAATLGDHIDLSTGETASKQWTDDADVVYAVNGDWATGETASIDLTTGEDPAVQFSPHAAYGTADCGIMQTWDQRSIPRVVYKDGNGVDVDITVGLRNMAPTMRIDGTLMKQAIWETHQLGWHVWHVLTIFKDQAIARIQTIFRWSDDTYFPDWKLPCRSVRCEYGMEVKPIFQANEGWQMSNSNKTVTLPMTFANATWEDGWQNWANNMWHGMAFCMEAWMFGRVVGTTVPGDETAFTDCAELDAVAGFAEWDGSYLSSGAVGPEPLYKTRAQDAIAWPLWSETDRHYVSWDRGYDANDGTGKQGLMMKHYARTQGFAGTYGMHMGGAVIYGHQELRDYRAAVRMYGMRVSYMKRDGTYAQPSTVRGQQFCVYESFPHNNSGVWYTDSNFGRFHGGTNEGNKNWIKPPADVSTDGISGEQYTISLLTAYYQLAKWDYFAEQLCRDNVSWHILNSLRGSPFMQGAQMSGHRVFGRTINGAIQLYDILPESHGDIAAVLWGQTGSYGAAMKTNAWGASHPPTTGRVWTFGNFTPGLTAPPTWPNFTRSTDSIFEQFGALGAYILYRYTGDPQYLEFWERSMQSCMLYLSCFAVPGAHNLDSSYVYTYGGWYASYEVLIDGTGTEIPESQRQVPLNNGLKTTSGLAQLSGPSLSRWSCGPTYLYSQIGQDATAKARAQSMYNTILQWGAGELVGWAYSSWVAAASYTD